MLNLRSPGPLLGACSFLTLVACGAADRPRAVATPTSEPAGAHTAQTSPEPFTTSSAIPVLAGSASPPHAHAHHGAAPEDGDSFDSLMHTAMVRMDEGMNVACTHDPDVDFAAMMVPHHQGAVDMAIVELRYGTDPRLRRLAQGIIVEQRQEIALMNAILAEKRPE